MSRNVMNLNATWDQESGRDLAKEISPDRMTDTCKNITFLQLRWRAVIRKRVESELLSMCVLILCDLQGMDENKSKKKRGAFGFFRRMGRTVLKTRHTEYNIEPDTNLRGSKKYKKQVDPEQQVRGLRRLQLILSLWLINSLIVKGRDCPIQWA